MHAAQHLLCTYQPLSLWHQRQSWLMQGVHSSQSREAKQADIVLGLCCVPGYLLRRSAVKPNPLPSLPPSPFTSSQLRCLFFHLSFVHGLPPPAFVSHCTSLPPPDKIVTVCCLRSPSTLYRWTHLQCKPFGTKTAVLSVGAVPTTQTSQCNLSPLGVA